jgi:uncharacterized protein (DUF433 family)
MPGDVLRCLGKFARWFPKVVPGSAIGDRNSSVREESPPGAARAGDGVAFRLLARHTGVVTADQLEMISTDPRVMHGQAVIAGTRVAVSVILDCLAAGMTAEEITAEYPTVTVAGVRAAAAYGAALAREELVPLPQSR